MPIFRKIIVANECEFRVNMIGNVVCGVVATLQHESSVDFTLTDLYVRGKNKHNLTADDFIGSPMYENTILEALVDEWNRWHPSNRKDALCCNLITERL